LYCIKTFLFQIICCSVELSIHPENSIVSTNILGSTTVFNIDNTKKCLPHQHNKVISEGSCDTEDWSNDAENSALPSQE